MPSRAPKERENCGAFFYENTHLREEQPREWVEKVIQSPSQFYPLHSRDDNVQQQWLQLCLGSPLSPRPPGSLFCQIPVLTAYGFALVLATRNHLPAPRNSGLAEVPLLRAGCSSAGDTDGSHARAQHQGRAHFLLSHESSDSKEEPPC